MRKKFFYIFLLMACFTSSLYLVVNPFRASNRLQVLDTTTFGDRQVVLLAQRYNGSLFEPSTISVYQVGISNQWMEYYLDDGSTFWRQGSLEKIDEKSFWVCRGKRRIAKLDCAKSQLTLLNRDQTVVYEAFPVDRNPLDDIRIRPQDMSTL